MNARSLDRSGEVADLNHHRDRLAIERVAGGEQEAFGELFRRYGSATLGVAARVLGDRGLAEEVAQEVFVALWKRAGEYDSSRGTVRSWLLAQAHHRAVDVVRREEAERRRTTTSYAQASPLPGPEDVDEEAWLADRRSRVRSVLGFLPDEQRAVIEKTYFEGMTQAQAAQALKMPLGTVKSRTLAAMRKLRDELARQGGERR